MRDPALYEWHFRERDLKLWFGMENIVLRKIIFE